MDSLVLRGRAEPVMVYALGAQPCIVLELVPYSPYSHAMAKLQHRGAEEARNQLPALLAEAAKGRTTIITRHGRSVAALVPIKDVAASRQKPLTALSGTGKGMWGKTSTTAVRRLRDEWSQ